MPFTLTMPKLSPTMTEGTLTAWHKKPGEFVEAGDLLIEVATDKATVEHSALDEGWLRQILIQEGETAVVNQAIAIFTEEKDESIEGYEPEGELIEESKVGVIEEESTQTVTKPATVTTAGMQQPAFMPEPPLEDYTFDVSRMQERIVASPLAKKLATQQGLDLSTVKGSGPGGRVVATDLERAQADGSVAFDRTQAPQKAPGSYQEIPLTPMRKMIATRLQEAKTFIPHFYVKQTVNAEPLFRIREELLAHDVKVTFNDFIMRACALALKEHREVNSGFNTVNQTIVQYETIDVCVAVGVEGGVITPIIRHTDFKSVGAISKEVRALAKRARAGKLEPHEYKGGSFTISNLGMFGVDDFYAVINPPQAAILAVGGILDVPVVKEGQVVAGKTLCLALSADHRVVDGIAAARFLKTVQKYIENPAGLLL